MTILYRRGGIVSTDIYTLPHTAIQVPVVIELELNLPPNPTKPLRLNERHSPVDMNTVFTGSVGARRAEKDSRQTLLT